MFQISLSLHPSIAGPMSLPCVLDSMSVLRMGWCRAVDGADGAVDGADGADGGADGGAFRFSPSRWTHGQSNIRARGVDCSSSI